MDENKFAELIKNDDFIDGLLGCSSREEMRKIFESYNQTVSEDELDYFVETIEKALQTANSLCSDESMEAVAGGTDISRIDGIDIEANQKYNPIDHAVLQRAAFKVHQDERFQPGVTDY